MERCLEQPRMNGSGTHLKFKIHNPKLFLPEVSNRKVAYGFAQPFEAFKLLHGSRPDGAVAVVREGPLTAAERRLVEDVPPHHGQ